MKVILASKSPRRRDFLEKYSMERGFFFEIITKPTDENIGDIHPRDGVIALAIRKGEVVANEHPNTIVISSDTLVELDGIPLGKPKDENDAKMMLRSLSGRAHNVHTGIAVHYNGKAFSGVASTAVIFKELSDSEIDEYINSGEPMDKAGAYGIQGEAGKFVLRYDGEFDTVVGFNMALLRDLLRQAKPDFEW